MSVSVPVDQMDANDGHLPFEDLAKLVKGALYLKGTPNFTTFTGMFNGNVVTAAKAVVIPVDAKDISATVLFCAKHSLSPSIKAGGYGTAGWAIGGDVVIDLRQLQDVDIEVPAPDGSYTSLADMSPGKGKDKQVATGKRRRAEPQLEYRGAYHLASEAVESFLTTPPSAIRRRLDVQGNSAPADRPSYSESSSNGSSTSESSSNWTSSSASTETASPVESGSSPHRSPIPQIQPLPSTTTADPFGYLTSGPAPIQDVLPMSTPSLSQLTPSWSSGIAMSTPFRMGIPQPMMPSQFNILAPPTPIHSHAYVSFGAGMLQKQIDIFCTENPIEATSVSGTTCTIPYHVPFAAHPVGSSIMILGGFGFLSRLHGLSVDNLVEVEMVLADGEIVVVNKETHPDLWWAVRGAGPAFGIATRYKAKAYPVPHVFAGNIIYRFHKATAPSLIKHFRDCVKGAPRELYANVLLTAGPLGKDSLVVIQMCYSGPREKGQEILSAISSWTGDSCLLNEVDEKSFLHQQDSVAQVLRGKAGRQWFIRSALITSLPDDIIHDTVNQFADTPVGCTWLFEVAGGAISDIDDSCIPKTQREALFTIAALHQWEMDLDDQRCVSSAEDWIAESLLPYQTGGPFPSFLGRHEPPERIISCYGEKNFDRLKEIKKKYDPQNMFSNNMWPLNSAGELAVREPSTPGHSSHDPQEV